MKKLHTFFFLSFIITTLFSQDIHVLEKKTDSISYVKNLNYSDEKDFKDDLKTKYTGREFTYKEEIKKEEETPIINNSNFYAGFAHFMKFIFPYLLGAIVIFIILKLYLGADAKFWNFKNSTKKISKKLVYEDDNDIHNTDLENLLRDAINNKNNRLAIRYYYLVLLKQLSNKEIIKYDKDKTNSDYLFEIKETKQRSQFSYLSYIYTYVWYGEFNLNEEDFIKVQEKYKSFFKTIH